MLSRPKLSVSAPWLLLVLSVCLMTKTMTMAFSATRLGRNKALPRLFMSVKQQDQGSKEEAIECFIVNFFEVEEEGAAPHVVCTSQPEEYAWFNGIDRQAMKETDGILEGALECVEGASPRGYPEWECSSTLTESSWQ